MMPPAAKTEMFQAGVFSGMDIIVRSHASSATSRPAPGFGTCCLNIDGVKYTFSGAPAHQMTSWNGRNAREAVIHLFNNIDAVRSSMRPEARVQGVITEGGAAPNVVPGRTQADFYIRYPDEVYLKTVREFVDKFNEDQRGAVHQVLSNEDEIQAIQGTAGAGKTTTLRAIREAAQREGYEVSGRAPTSRAAHPWRWAGRTNGPTVLIAFDPQTPGTIYAAADRLGAFKTTDGEKA
jgi:acetylornithine deacetylase/succinyl-diaminopimelate desuccinylase-like protein